MACTRCDDVSGRWPGRCQVCAWRSVPAEGTRALSSVAFCQPVNTAVASEPVGKEAVMTATMAVSLSQPATCRSTDTPPRGTERVVRSGLQGS